MIEALQDKLGYRFSDPTRLRLALTHSTYANENPGVGDDNERLELLGDAVLDLLVAHLLYERLPEAGEGDLSRRRAHVVRGPALAALAKELDLGPALWLGQGQRRTGETDSILADAYEAVVGAVFLDGGYPAAAACFGPRLTVAIEAATRRIDFKTRLQEICHARGGAVPVYKVVEESGPAHRKEFRSQVSIGGEILGEGVGRSKKDAEQEAAERALESLETRT